jgi:hypothetical protein
VTSSSDFGKFLFTHYLTAPKVSPETIRFLTIMEITKTGAMIVTDAALRLPQSVPYIPVNS